MKGAGSPGAREPYREGSDGEADSGLPSTGRDVLCECARKSHLEYY